MTRRFATNWILLTAIFMAVLGILATLSGNPIIATLLGLPSYLILPGFLLQFGLCRKIDLNLSVLLYGVGLSLLFWLIGGLAINTLLPLFHIDTPLQLRYLLDLYAISIIGLCIACNYRKVEFTLTMSTERFETNGLVIAIAALLPILAVLGATVLNNGGPGTVSMIMLTIAIIYILAISIGHRRVNPSLYPVAVFGLSCALLLMYSMRSWHVTGWDIQKEFEVFSTTLAHNRWSMSYWPNLDTDACLSITILPTVLTKLLHVSPEYIFKLIFQLIFAVTPVVVYATARRFLPAVMAFLAAVLFISQTWFFELMPAVTRQEIAIVFFALFVFALTEVRMPRKVRSILLFAFSLGIVVSHYSTAYLWLTICIIATVCLWAMRLGSTRARSNVGGLTWPLLITSAALIFFWEGPITNTSGTLNSNLSGFGSQISESLSPATLHAALAAAVVGPPETTGGDLLNAYNQALANRTGVAGTYYPRETYAGFKPAAVDTDVTAHNYLPGSISSLVHLAASAVKAITDNLMAVVGIVVLAFYFLRRRREINLEFIALCIATYLVIIGALLVPMIQEVYNLPRLGLQSYALLVIPVIAAFWFAFRQSRWTVPITAIFVVIILGSQSGLIDQFTGGIQHMTLNQHGTLDAFYVNDDELAAAQWLSANRDPAIPIYADPLSNMRLEAHGGITVQGEELFPNDIPRQSYVFLNDANTSPGYAYLALNNAAVYFNTPTAWLGGNKNLIFTAGGARVYQ
jgi:uncharacterized membrane protein